MSPDTTSNPTRVRWHLRPRKDLGAPVPPRLAALAILGAAAAGAVTYGVVRLLGVEPVAVRAGTPAPVTLVDVLVAVVVAGLLAWGVREVLHRRGWAWWWPSTGSTALAISMVGPTYQSEGASLVALSVLHLTVGAALIAGLHVAGARPRDGRTTP